MARAWRFERRMQERCARSRREFELGTALYNDELRRVFDTNFVRFERGFDDLTGAAVEAPADELQASLPHRKVVIPDERAGARVTEELKERGWRYYTLVTMAYCGSTPGAAWPTAAPRPGPGGLPRRSSPPSCATRGSAPSTTAGAMPRRAARSSRS